MPSVIQGKRSSKLEAATEEERPSEEFILKDPIVRNLAKEALKPPRSVSEKQRESLKKGREKRAEGLNQRKIDAVKSFINDPTVKQLMSASQEKEKAAASPVQAAKAKKPKKVSAPRRVAPPSPPPQVVEEYSESEESESSEEEEEEDDESEEESEESEEESLPPPPPRRKRQRPSREEVYEKVKKNRGNERPSYVNHPMYNRPMIRFV